jgi:hypothetical protein
MQAHSTALLLPAAADYYCYVAPIFRSMRENLCTNRMDTALSARHYTLCHRCNLWMLLQLPILLKRVLKGFLRFQLYYLLSAV